MIKRIDERGAADIAKRALETTGQIFRYVIAHGRATRNPASEIRRADILRTTRKVNYARIDARELPDLLKRIEVYPGSHVTRLALKLMVLTFVRTTELREATWEEIDLENRRWNIPAERMKMKTPHIVPLASQAMETLDMLHSIAGAGRWLFPGERNPSKPMSNNTIPWGVEANGLQGQDDGSWLSRTGLDTVA